ncbi:MAG: dihydropteroate synthase [Clostridia bacterium]|nr:dihydropteroate synthase [Clostridia bacterium]
MFKTRNFTLPLGKKTYIMGVLNYTPDSFSDGGKFNSPGEALTHALRMQELGADIIDLGANSTRPGATFLTASEELERIAPALEILSNKLNIPLSVDTFYPAVAKAALEAGASIINDVSGEFNTDMAALAKEYGAGYVVMHNPCGSDTVMEYPDGVVSHIRSCFLDALKLAAECGLPKEQLCFDVGLGFSKSYKDNIEIMRNLEWLKFKGVPMLVAASRKRFIGIASGEENSALRDPGTVAAHTAAIAAGADIIRVHDVAGAVQGAKVADALFRKTGE